MLYDRLKAERNKRDLSQMALSKLIGVSQQTIGSWETGRTNPDPEMIKVLAEFFGVTTDYLLGNDIEIAKQEITDAVSDDQELREFWDKLKEREDLQILCKQTKSLSPTTIKRVIKYIKMVEDEEALEDD